MLTLLHCTYIATESKAASSEGFDLGHMNAVFLFAVSLVEGFRVEIPYCDMTLHSQVHVPVSQPFCNVMS